MFRSKEKEDILNALEENIKVQEVLHNHFIKLTEFNYNLRADTTPKLVGKLELYLTMLANSPKEFDTSFKNISKECDELLKKVNDFEKKEDSEIKDTLIGIAAVWSAMTLNPIALAATFGKESSRIALSSLSNAAGTTAGLTALSGGAVTMTTLVGGGSLFALGPVGWALGTGSIISGGVMLRKKNANIIKAANEDFIICKENIVKLNTLNKKLQETIELTQLHHGKLAESLNYAIQNFPLDYKEFDKKQKARLGALINNINSLTALIKKEI